AYVKRKPVARTPEQVVGKVARRTLLRGKPISLNALRDPYLVVKGHPVRVVYATAGITIVTYATSLKSGGEGEMIRVRNVDSGKIISGIVQTDGSLLVRRP
ncbi:MAG: flagellar basal body P-ring formation chaperone FlgA, partial [Aestuariivirgaceae bacterium]